jgi:hypothetical protein
LGDEVMKGVVGWSSRLMRTVKTPLDEKLSR